MIPDFSPKMLASFLAARVLHRAEERRLEAGKAERQIVAETARSAGIGEADIRAALSGRLRDGAMRAAVWAALGHFPADHGLLLTDNGGQRPLAGKAPFSREAAR